MILPPSIPPAQVAKTPLAKEAPQPKSMLFLKDESQWREARHKRLTSESGWLTLVGLHWLSEGENTFGSGPSNAVPLPEMKAPPKAGVFVLEHGVVRLKVAPGNGLRLDGKAAADQILKSDAEGKPDVLVLGDLSFFVIKRGERFGIRVKDVMSPVRTGFKGVACFAPDVAFRVSAEFVAYDQSKAVEIPTVLDSTETMQSPGYVKFKLHGKAFTLEPVIEDPAAPQLFFIFRDQTSGRETYPAGRFLYAAMPKNGKVILDFNQAYNPPCAFTHFATCPLPPPQNRLKVAIKAGEKTYEHH